MTRVPVTFTQPSSPSTPAAVRRWTRRRGVAVVAGVALAVCGVVVLISAFAIGWYGSARSEGGYVALDTVAASTDRAVLVDPAIVRDEVLTNDRAILSLFGSARIRVTAADPAQRIFVGMSRPGAADALLAGSGYTSFRDTARGVAVSTHDGAAFAAALEPSAIWLSAASGAGPQVVTAPAEDAGELVVITADGSTRLAITADLEASLPGLPWLVAGLAALGFIMLVAGGLLVILPFRRGRRA